MVESCAIRLIAVKSISDMPKATATCHLNRYKHLYNEVIHIERDIQQILEDCPKQTSCCLRYGFNKYSPGIPYKGSIKDVNGVIVFADGFEEWMLVLADYYAQEATDLLKKRDGFLKTMKFIASRYYRLTGTRLSWLFPVHKRKPMVKVLRY